MASAVRLASGSFDFSGGIDAGRVTTVVSPQNPHGLPYSFLAWLNNGTVRGGGITQRLGYQQIVGIIPGASGLFQGEYLYEPIGANPYLMLSIGGVIWKVLVEAPYTVTNLSAQFKLFNPSAPTMAHFAQGEQFLVIQAGDLTTNPPTLPLFWDGTTLRRSNGIQNLSDTKAYALTTTATWQIQLPGVGVVVNLAAPYPGAVNDVGVWSDVAGTINYGTFYVSAIAGNTVTLVTQSTSFIGANLNASTYTFTVGTPPATIVLSNSANFVVPAVGASVAILLDANYLGTVGDVLTFQPNGFFDPNPRTVVSVTVIGANTITIKTISSPYVGQTLTRGAYIFTAPSGGITPVVPTNELPAAGPMVYFHGQIWYANGRTVTAGDVVGDQSSGTLAYQFKDSILKVTENPLALGGDGFQVPDNAGNVTALDYAANDNTVLGQGPVLYVFTRKQIYGLQVPFTRADWINANSNNQPLMTVVQRRYGSVGDRCVVPVNGDLFYQSLETAIRSLKISIRNDDSWLNPPISRNEDRVLAFNDRSLMSFATGIQFDNRLLQSVLPFATPVGVAFRGLIPLDFDIISSFGQEEASPPPAWEGMTQGLNHLQLTEGDFGGRQRAFSTCYGDDGNIQIWELTDFLTVDTLPSAEPEGNRVSWYFETPAYDFGKIFELKRLDGAEIYIDLVYGTVEWKLEYRTDADNCWQNWQAGKFCSAKNDCEAGTNPDPTCSYPVATLCQGQRFPLGIAKPQQPATCVTMNQRPATDGFQFQVRLNLKGYCRVRGLLIFALPVDRQPFYNTDC